MPRGAGAEAAAVKQAGAAAAAVAPLLALAGGALQHLALQALLLHRATAKLGYVAAALLAGVVKEGFCTPDVATEGERLARHLVSSHRLIAWHSSLLAVAHVASCQQAHSLQVIIAIQFDVFQQ